jgi:hypothetical protein
MSSRGRYVVATTVARVISAYLWLELRSARALAAPLPTANSDNPLIESLSDASFGAAQVRMMGEILLRCRSKLRVYLVAVIRQITAQLLVLRLDGGNR